MKKIILIIAAISLITGCAKPAPKCSDEKTIGSVLQITKEQASKRVPLDDLVIKLEAIRTTGTDDKTGAQSCAGEIVMESKKMGNIPLPKIPITFKSEMTDTKEHYVSVKGL